MFHDIIKGQGLIVSSFSNILNIFKNKLYLVIELRKCMQLILTVAPITTCTTERSFSVLRRLNHNTRSTMTQNRLNNLAVLNCPKTIVESLDYRMFSIKMECNVINLIKKYYIFIF